MLEKDNLNKILEVFFDNPIQEGGFQLREISRKINVAPKSVKLYLEKLEKEKLIFKKTLHSYPVYHANRDYDYFKFLKKINTIKAIKESGLLDFLYDTCLPNVIIMFGSASKGEDIMGSDIDIYLQCAEKKLILNKFETKLKRKINTFFEKSFGKLSTELKNNIINGVILKGYLSVAQWKE